MGWFGEGGGGVCPLRRGFESLKPVVLTRTSRERCVQHIPLAPSLACAIWAPAVLLLNLSVSRRTCQSFTLNIHGRYVLICGESAIFCWEGLVMCRPLGVRPSKGL